MSEWWRGAVIYQVYPRSFCDSNGDGIGDLAGITSKLEYVADLGVDAIWISPFFKSPMKDFGYDVEDFRQVDPVFGDLDDFDTLIRKAHSLGLKVVIDQVYLIALINVNGLRKADRATVTASQIGIPGQMPSKTAHHQITGNLLLAVPPGPGTIPVNSITCIISCRNSPTSTCTILKSARNCWRLRDFGWIGALMVFAWMRPITLCMIRLYPITRTNTHLWKRTLITYPSFYTTPAIGEAVRYWDDFETVWPSWTFNNHDGPRVVSRWGNGFDPVQLAKTLQTLLVMLRGTLFMYQGEELGLPQAGIPFEKLKDPEAIANWPDTMGRDGARTPMPWSDRDNNGDWPDKTWMPLDEAHFALNAERQKRDTDSPLNYCGRLLQFRKQHPALVDGSIKFIDCPKDMLVFVRASEKESILCVFNLGQTEQQWVPKSEGTGTSKSWLFDFGGTDQNNPFTLPPLGGYIKEI